MDQSKEPIETDPKQIHWQEITEKVDRIVDKLNLPVDDGIKESIISLHAFGFHTTASCEGHDAHATDAPYIDIETEEVEAIEIRLRELKKKAEGQSEVIVEQLKAESHEIILELERKNLEERKKIIGYLDEFYKDREVSYETRLVVQGKARGWSRLESQGTDIQEIRSEEEKKTKLKEYQEEMWAFTEFLKNKYFAE